MTYLKRPMGPEGEGEMTEQRRPAELTFATISRLRKKSVSAIRTAFCDAGVEFHRQGERGRVIIVVWSQPW
jgi:hypothetical protein